MDIEQIILALAASGGVGTAIITAGIRGWQQSRRARKQTPYLKETAQTSRLILIEYAQMLAGILRRLSAQVPAEPVDPLLELSKKPRSSASEWFDAVISARLVWRDYIYELRGLIRQHGGTPPEFPSDPYYEALRARDPFAAKEDSDEET